MFQDQVLSVSRLVELLKEVVEDNFLEVTVEGEISNCATPSSGHHYFTLKDNRCQVRAVMFRQYNRLLRFSPEDGMQVLCRGRLTVYPQRGELQMVVEHLELCGEGGLQAAYEELRLRLEREGLFARERKRALPTYPKTVGVVTSGTGAAIRDILQVLRRRAAGVRVVICPVRVQGTGAAEEIVRAVELFNRHQAADVLIVGRGGGSLEDLWAFNEEPVARALYASHIPVISAVGHEVDTTIADYVADYRAPTPSAAAEVVVRSCQEIESHLDHLQQRLKVAQSSRLRHSQEKLEALADRLRSPRQLVADMQRRLQVAEERLRRAMKHTHERKTAAFQLVSGRLEAYSPQATLQRGYSIVTRADGRRVVTAADQASPGEVLGIRFAQGQVRVTVDEVDA
ncbi:MAG: exodeoxyribonuclease VII large subunit [Desulfuromonas sp.]|nr:MAG: exodeoxyribonuclease VII large subunit [Desulfuromonas sp.]